MTIGGYDKDGNYLIFIGVPERASQYTNEYDPFFMNVQDWFCPFKQKVIDSFKEVLPKKVIKIIDIPLPCVNSKEGIWTVYSYNNMLVEIYGGVKRVILPTYIYKEGENNILKEYENEVAEKLCKQGFSITRTEDMSFFMEEYSSIRCLTKIINRNYDKINT